MPGQEFIKTSNLVGERMESIDEEILAATKDFIKRAQDAKSS